MTKYCKHKTYGLGYAIKTRNRKDPNDDLWMCRFYQFNEVAWFCTKHFMEKEEIEFISDEEADSIARKAKISRLRNRK
jgi:hypothetical protein